MREYVATRRLWRIAVLTAAGAIGAASHAEAALYYWSDFDSGFSQPAPTVTQRRQKPRLRHGKKLAAPEKESAKPQGPLIIAISIQSEPEDLRRQRLLRGNSDFHRHARASDADGRVQRHPETQAAPLQHL